MELRVSEYGRDIRHRALPPGQCTGGDEQIGYRGRIDVMKRACIKIPARIYGNRWQVRRGQLRQG
ncbi:hypothetical protein KCP73_06455 [Salmonella enterica subsp. enterica]|nr:hypothetical protein KCP73_06455 [Salmonella enterica subsp. enterica]